jgi:hypothetical protein
MKYRLSLFAVCLMVAATLGAEVPQPGQRKAQVPRRFIKVDVLDVGEFIPLGDWSAMSAHIASVTCVIDRVRFGVTAADLYSAVDYWDGSVVLPVHVGYNILTNPEATWLVWGAVPDLHVDAIGTLWENRRAGAWPVSLQYSPTIEVALCCDVDYYGLGAGLQVGAYKSAAIGSEASNTGLFAELRLRLLTFGVGF